MVLSTIFFIYGYLVEYNHSSNIICLFLNVFVCARQSPLAFQPLVLVLIVAVAVVSLHCLALWAALRITQLAFSLPYRLC